MKGSIYARLSKVLYWALNKYSVQNVEVDINK